MPLLAIFLVLLVLFIVGIWLTFNLLGLLITLVVAAVVGAIADRIVPGELPYGWLGTIVAGLAGSWLGSLLLGGFGPDIAGIALIPALVGAIILAFVAQLAVGQMGRRGA